MLDCEMFKFYCCVSSQKIFARNSLLFAIGQSNLNRVRELTYQILIL